VEQGGPQAHECRAQLVARLWVAGANEGVEQCRAARVELLGRHVARPYPVQGRDLGKRVPLRVDPDLVGAEHLGGGGQAGAQGRVVVGGRNTEAQARPGKVVGRDGHPAGHHEPAGKAT